jgi:hypothetical protein
MAVIRTRIDQDIQLTTRTVEGSVNLDDFLMDMDSAADQVPTRLILWDCRQADLSGMSNDDIHVLAESVQPNMVKRSDCKIAVVVSSDLDYGLSRVYEALVHTDPANTSFMVFRNMQKAREWLGI